MRGAGDHILQKLDVAGRVEYDVTPSCRAEENSGGINGDALGLLVLQGIEQERIFKWSRRSRTMRPHRLELTVGKRAGICQKPTHDRALAVVHMAGDHDCDALVAS